MGGSGEVGLSSGKADDGSAFCFEGFGFGVDLQRSGFSNRGDALR